jgi:hypothetical protein
MRIDSRAGFFCARYTAGKSSTFYPAYERWAAVSRSACLPLFKPWGDPTNWRDPAIGIGRPDGFGGPPASYGAHFLMSDGSVRFRGRDNDRKVLEALSTPPHTRPAAEPQGP